MMRFVLLLSILSALNLSAQDLSTFPELPFSDFGNFDVQGDKIIANSSCDLIWYSSDDGENWDYVQSPETIYDVKLWPNDSENRAFLVGRGVYIFDFEDGVISSFPNEMLFPAGEIFRKIEINATEVFVIGSENVIAASLSDLAWQEIYQDTFSSDYIYTSELFDDHLYLGGRQGKLVQLNIGTKNWEIKQDFGDWIRNISMGTSDVGYIVSNAYADILKTTDSWDNFVPMEDMPERIQPLAFGDQIVLTINTNRIYVSTDGGVSSTYVETGNTEYLGLAYVGLFTEDGTLYLAGRGAMMARTDDLAQNWEHLNPINRSDLFAIAGDESGHTIAVGDHNTFYKSNDFGKTWSAPQVVAFTNGSFAAALILGPDKYLVSDNDITAVIENGTIVSSEEGPAIAFLKLANEQGILAVREMGGDYAVYKSTDMGATWELKSDLPEYATLISQSNEGKLFIGNQEEVYTSTDNGETWQAEIYGLSGIREVVFYDNQFGLATSSNKLYRTTDGGVNFEEIASGYAIRNIHFLEEGKFFYTTATNSSTNLRMTEDGGDTFSSFFNNCATTYASFVNSNNEIVLAQRNGHIQIVPTEQIMNASNEQEISKLEIELFPNPIESGAILNCSESVDNLVIFNSIGNRFESIKQSDRQFLLPVLATGIYFVRMEKNGVSKLDRILIGK